MAETVHLYLKANGSDVQGDSTQTSLERENTIECLFFESGITSVRETGSRAASGRRQHQPILIRKRIDKSSPLISKALCNNEVIEGTFKFFRPNPAGDGTTQQFFTVKIMKGRVASQRLWSPDALVLSTASEPPLEEVTLVFHTIEWTYTDGGVTHQGDWGANN